MVSFYHQTLKESREALRYLESSGLTHPEMIERFQIGFANRKAGEEMRGRLQRLGILRESGHEHFNGSVVIPVLDLAGNDAAADVAHVPPRPTNGISISAFQRMPLQTW